MRRPLLLLPALVVPVLPVLAAAPAYAVDNVICVGSPAGPCDDVADSISQAIDEAEVNGLPDTILVGPGNHQAPGSSAQLSVTDGALTLRGSGEGITFLTLPPSGQQTYLVLDGAVARDLTIAMNTTDSSGDRGITLYNGAAAVSVTVAGIGTTNTTGATMIDSSLTDASLLLDVDTSPSTRGIFSEGGNTVSDVTVTASTGLDMSAPGGTDTLSRMDITARDYGIVVDGGTSEVDDTLIELANDNGVGLAAANFNPGIADKTINADHVTIVGGGSGSAGAHAYAGSPGVQQLSAVNLTNSIIAGPERSLVVEASNDGTPGGDSSAFINASYSNWDPDDQVVDIGANGVGDVVSGAGNVDVTPGFVDAVGDDYRLLPSSALVDAGDPAPGGPALDLDGLSRVVDGNADGTAVRDMGAFEYRVPAPPTPPAPPADTTAPDTTITKKPAKKVTARKVKFRFVSNEAGVTFQCKRDAKAYRPCASPLRWKVKLGKHVLLVRAVDAAGNVDATPARYKFKRIPKP